MLEFRTAEKIFWAGALALFLLNIGLGAFGTVFHSTICMVAGSIVGPLILAAWGPFCRLYLSKE